MPLINFITTRLTSLTTHQPAEARTRRAVYVLSLAAPLALALACTVSVEAQTRATPRPAARSAAAPQSADALLIRILAAEDARRWDVDLASLLDSRAAATRSRVALAAGRIGDERAVAPLARLLRTDADEGVRVMAAFALGEIESPAAADALLEALRANRSFVVRARAVEALGKIAAALPDGNEIRRASIGDAMLGALNAPTPVAATAASGTARTAPRAPRRESAVTLNAAQTDFILAALTAALRARPANASQSVQRHLTSPNAEVRATALNTLARLRVSDANEVVRPLLNDADPIVRANAARVLGAAEDRQSLDALIARMKDDTDERVRVSAIRALASIKDARAAAPLGERFDLLLANYRAARGERRVVFYPAEASELLELSTALGGLLANTSDAAAQTSLRALRETGRLRAPEIEVALARIAPVPYLRDPFVIRVTDAPANSGFGTVASIAEGLGEVARVTGGSEGTDGNTNVSLRADALIRLLQMLDAPGLPAPARPTVLRALAAFDQAELLQKLTTELTKGDIFTRATAAELLGEAAAMENATPATRLAVTQALIAALPRALVDAEPDAAVAILNALAQMPASPVTTTALESALAAKDYIVRRRAAALLEARNPGRAAAYRVRVGAVATQFDTEDYQRALARRSKRVLANVVTDKGAFTIELLPDVAPLTVDNFVQLAQKGFFNNITFHRVVPNFVAQTGDPRGDGNGSPGYQIRDEINTVPYARGAIGMALSGKDTGGSQWFVTHSPQPHLDGGYTVFGNVISGMDVVDRLVRGDRLARITVTETERPTRRAAPRTRSTR